MRNSEMNNPRTQFYCSAKPLYLIACLEVELDPICNKRPQTSKNGLVCQTELNPLERAMRVILCLGSKIGLGNHD